MSPLAVRVAPIVCVVRVAVPTDRLVEFSILLIIYLLLCIRDNLRIWVLISNPVQNVVPNRLVTKKQANFPGKRLFRDAALESR